MSNPRKNIDLQGSHFATQLRIIRESKHLTKAELGEAAGLTYRTVHDLEMGRRDRIQEKTLNVLAEALEITVFDLLGRQIQEPSVETESAEEPPQAPPNVRRTLSIRLAVLGALVVVLVLVGWNLWSFARQHAEWTITADSLEARDRVFGVETWSIHSENRIDFCRLSPWSSHELLVGFGSQTPDGGCLLMLDRASGDTIWVARPDLNAVERAFGPEDVGAANFSCLSVEPIDWDGDGVPELLTQYVHGLYYPHLVTVVDHQGQTLAQYSHKGHIYGSLIVDLDDDGRQEFLGCGTNNAPDYQGASIFMLDREHWRGASIDDHCDSWSDEPDSARIRLVIPQFPAPYMRWLQITRLSAIQPQVHRSQDGTTLISISVGAQNGTAMIVYMDGDLHPTGCVPTDSFLEQLGSGWPDSLVTDTGPGDPVWRAQWLANHRRFEAGHWPPGASP